MEKHIKEDILRLCAAHPYYKGFEAGLITEDGQEITGTVVPKNAKIIGAWCKVYRKDRERPHHVSVMFSEYDQSNCNDEYLRYMWERRPNIQIRRVAVSYCHKEAFPELLAGLFLAEELGDDLSIIKGRENAVPIDEKPKQPQPQPQQNNIPSKPLAQSAQLKDKTGVVKATININSKVPF